MGVTPLNYHSTLVNKSHQMMNSTQKRRSFKRRRVEHNGNSWSWLAGLTLLCGIVVSPIEAVPMNSGFVRIHNHPLVGVGGLQFWHQRVARDVTAVNQPQSASLQQQKDKDMLIQGSSTEITMDQPQGQCLLDGEYVPETTVFCEKQVGCRAIQKTGHCCPDYKCDCQKDGKTYLNGDKLVDPETPCTVCYCQGGEILCSSVTCFHRDDCTPKYIPGVCCPEYDNCPVASSVNKTLTTTTSTTAKPELPPIADDNKPKITIKEITKPTEIRITDDNKVIPVPQMLKPTTTSTTTTTTTTTTMPTLPAIVSTTAMPAVTENTPIQADAINGKLSESTQPGIQSTIVDTNHNVVNGNTGTKLGINSGDTLKLTASVAYPQSVHPTTTVLANGLTSTVQPQLAMENSGEVEDPVPALSVFSTQGLPEDPSKVNIKREYFITTESIAPAAGGQAVYGDGVLASGEYSNAELIYGSQSNPTTSGHQALHQSSAELDADTAGSDNIYHIILTTDGPRLTSTSENYLALKGTSSTEGSPFEDVAPIAVDAAPVEPKPQAPATTEGPELSKHEHVHQHLDDEEPEIPLEINPAYPSLPADDFSIRGDNNYQLSDNDDIGEEPRSIGGGHIGHGHHLMLHHELHHDTMAKNSKHLDDASFGSGSGSGNGMDMIVEDMSVIMASSTEGSGGMDLNAKPLDTMEMERSMKKSPEVIEIMYSAEDSSSEETHITNSTDFQEKEKKNTEDSSLESMENLKPLEESLVSGEFGSGSGDGELKTELKLKEREPTTPKPYKAASSGDIDELTDSSGNGPQDDPKEDAESLKLDDPTSDATADAEKSPKGNILSVKVHQDKALHEELV
ncbi:uncharacterized protein [Musca autumnalis]|uniref:uncharacterized protein n=1 Tax=Musca autumnalis TaxID=221902 RepID=UPI003CEF28B9